VTFPDVHLADEAIAAFVDDGLSTSARQRAERHIRACLECREVVGAQREAQVLLTAAPDPELPPGLLARLREIPMTTDLGGSDFILVADEQGLAWASAPPPGPDPRLTVATEPAPALVGAVAGAPGASAASRRPRRGTPGPGRARPRSYPSVRSARPARRGRRRLAGALAGLAFGVIASAASTTAPNTAAPVGQLNTGTGTFPVVNRSGGSGPLELNTLRVGTERRQSDLLPASRRGR
jgi:anti-sigma factor RsiW